MRVQGTDYRTIWMDGPKVFMINQLLIPFRFEIHASPTYQATCDAISTMVVRGAGAIGAAAGFAMAQACLEAPYAGYGEFILNARKSIESTRPTAHDLFFAVGQVYDAGMISPEQAVLKAHELAEKNACDGKRIGEYGQELIREGYRIQTHCNAGWLGLVDYGSALAPVYLAHRQGKKLFVWVDETRPRNQGARLTAWELQQEDIPFAIIADHAAAYLMSRGEVDLVIVGADRIAANGDVANKIGTLALAIAACEFGVPFYVAAPTSTMDPSCHDGTGIVVEERSPSELLYFKGYRKDIPVMEEVSVCPPGAEAWNPAFDITPARLIKGIITEKGIISPSRETIMNIMNL
ncbi:MAG: S-methyl-5-thioribose-1-phosphate isomerase [Bacteroidales bacterium]|nr:S-methyl-5-thioribose-1-phosphate isomerase [Lentimicrobiaceae bacterium]MDD5695113.1 S-methyl-5-thioribose-1-phosphate isomerase [Bacteroidales bacterium]